MRIIYADRLFGINFIVDYLLLFAAARLCSEPYRRGRWALGAAFGGGYAVLAVVWPQFFAMATVKLLAGCATALLGLGTERAGRKILCFAALAFAFGGTVSALCTLAGLEPSASYIPVSIPVLLCAFAVCYAAVSLVFRVRAGRPERRIVSLEVTLGDKTLTLPALVDTGNRLRDPATGLGAAVAEAKTAAELFPAEVRDLLSGDPMEVLPQLRNCPGKPRLIFCRSVGGTSIAMLCFTPDEAAVEGEKRPMCLAVTPNALSPDGEYRALINLQ